MRFVQRSIARLQLLMEGQKAIGMHYRPVLSSIHVAGACIEIAIDPVMAAIGLPLEASEDFFPPRIDRSVSVFPKMYDSDDLTREAIWRVILATKPKVVVETGVANGLSTQTILSALHAIGNGHLYSFDIEESARESVPKDLRSRWTFTALNAKTAMRDLRKSVEPWAPEVGVWFHDSDHGYRWQSEEYRLASKCLAPGGILITDDADGTEAFADFCSMHPSWLVSALFDTRKVCGFARKPHSS